MRGLVELFVAVALAAGCGSYRPVAALDDAERAEFEMLRARLATTTIVVESGSPESATRYADWLRACGFLVAAPASPVPPGTPIVTIDESSTAPLGSDGGLTWLTLGLLPTFGSHSYECTVAMSGRDESASCETSTRWVFGWFGLALSLLPDWDSMGALYGPLLFYGRASPGDRLALLLCRALGAAPPR